MIENDQKEEGRDLSEYLKRSFYEQRESEIEKVDIGEFNDFEL
ncbi:hypothetical protein [Proteus mirabilis]